MRVCIVGLGRMGKGVAVNLVNRGHVVHGYDVNKSIYAALNNVGVKTVDNVGQCGDADYVVLALPRAGSQPRY